MQLSGDLLASVENSSRDSSTSPLINEEQAGSRAPQPENVHSALSDLRAQYASLHEKLDLLLAKTKSAATDRQTMAVRCAGRIVLLDFSKVDWIQAADNYVHLHAGKDSYPLRETMSSIESRLPVGRFVRINRSAIVNLEHIKELEPLTHGEYVVCLRNGKRLTLTRGYREKVQQLWSV